MAFLLVAGAGIAHESRDVQLAAASEAIARMPRNAELYVQRGNIHRMESQWDVALADYARAAELDPGAAEFGLLRAKALHGKGLTDAAAAELDRFLKDNPAHADARLTRARVRRDQALFLAAASDYAAALRHMATPSPDLYLECAESLEHAGPAYRSQALAILDAGMRKLGPLAVLENAAITIEMRLARFDPALRRVDVLLEQPGRKEQWLVRKAEILERAGRGQEALECYRAAAQAMTALPGERRRNAAVQDLAQRVTTAIGTLEHAKDH